MSAVVNSAAVNVGVHISFGIRVFSRYMSRSGLLFCMAIVHGVVKTWTRLSS